jgi:hypothetical protein
MAEEGPLMAGEGTSNQEAGWVEAPDEWRSSAPAFLEEYQAAAEKIARAIRDEGVAPAFHRSLMRAHRRQWPTLWQAIDELLRVFDRSEG